MIRAPGRFLHGIVKIADFAGRAFLSSIIVLGSLLPKVVFVCDAVLDVDV